MHKYLHMSKIFRTFAPNFNNTTFFDMSTKNATLIMDRYKSSLRGGSQTCVLYPVDFFYHNKYHI